MSKKQGSLTKASAFLFTLLCIAFSLYIFSIVYNETASGIIPFDTDESDHANPALYLYLSIKNWDLAEIYHAITRQAFYPPLYSLVISTNYFMSGVSFATSRLPALFCFVIYGLLIFTTLRKTLGEKDRSLFIPSIALLLASTSPITIYNSSLCMLELPGLVSVCFCILSFFTNNIPLQVIAALSVFFVKYNFGIISIPAAILTILFKDSFKKAFRSGIAIVFAIIIWSRITDYDSFKNFFTGHKDYVPMLSSENIFFELNSWITHYTLSPFIGVALLILAVIGFVSYRTKAPVLFSGLNVFFAFFVLFLSTTNEDRHFMVALPSLIHLSSLGLAALCSRLKDKSTVILSYTIAAVIISLFYKETPDIKKQIQIQFEGEQGFSELFQFIYNNTDSSKPILLYGISDSFSIEALRWFFSKTSGKYYTEINLDAYPYREDKNKTAKKRMRNLDAPFKIRDFPMKPLTRILDKNYYSYAVHINNKSRKQRFQKEGDELKATLAPRLKNKSAAGSHEIEVFSLL